MDRARQILGAASPPGKRLLRLVFPLLAACLLVASSAAAAPRAGTSSLRVLEASGVDTRTNGKILATDPYGAEYTCSGTALNTPSRSVVLTAGHCLVENREWGRNMVFIPAYDHEARPFGSFKVSATYVMPQWKRSENPDYDVAALRVRPNRFGRLVDVVGGRDWTTGRSRFARMQIFGYPAGALEGEALRSCEVKGLGIDIHINALPGPPTVPARCDMAGGSSGGAWLIGGRVAGVTSYGYTHNLGRLYSPYFGPAVGAFLASLP